MTWNHDVQTRLALLGFDPGPADGVLGTRTRNAIRACQAWHKDVAGETAVDPSLWPEKTISGRDGQPLNLAIKDTPSQWPRESLVPSFYGEMGQHLKRLALPYKMRLAWDRSEVIPAFSVHERVHDSAARCFQRIAETYTESERENLGLNIFSGCLSAPRMKRGSKSSWSMHSWGIAIDFDDTRNQLRWGRDRARLARSDCERFWEIWESEGWLSLGRAKNYDWMHVQAARL